MTVRVAVDFGTSSTCVVLQVDGRQPQVVVLDGQPLLPSAVYAAEDGTLFVGQEAERQAAIDPSRYEPHPKRRIDEGELLLGSTVLPVRAVIHAVLSRAVSEARRIAGRDVDLLVLTHPADWGVMRTRTLRQAAAGLAKDVTLLPEPVAAAVFHAATFSPPTTGSERTVEFSGSPGDVLAVLDLGGGTMDVSVVRHELLAGGGFRVLATKGDPAFGGADIDQLLLEHVGGAVDAEHLDVWRQLMQSQDLGQRRRRRTLAQDIRGAKETLSRHAYTDVPMPPPLGDAHVTRADLEQLVVQPLGRAVALAEAAIEESGLKAKHLVGFFLVGGSSRIPLVARLVHERVGIVPTTLDQPETVVARGALLSTLVPQGAGQATRSPSTGSNPVVPSTAGAPGSGQSSPPGGTRPAAQAGALPGQGPAPGSPPAGVPQPGAVPGPGPASGQVAQQRSPAAGMWPDEASRMVPTPPPAGRRGGRGWQVAALVAALVVVVVVLAYLLWPDGDDDSPPSAGDDSNTITQFDYSFGHLDDWQQTDTRRNAKAVTVRPEDALDGDNLVSVQQFDLSYSYQDNQERFIRELRSGLDAEEDKDYGDVETNVEFAGRTVTHYVERGTDKAVEWFVLGRDRVQISVGCQWTQDGKERVEAGCERVVGSLKIGGEPPDG